MVATGVGKLDYYAVKPSEQPKHECIRLKTLMTNIILIEAVFISHQEPK